jgi:hypothetical protein
MALVAAANAQAATSTGPQTLALNKDTLSSLGESLGKQPIAFVAVIKLKAGTDVDKFISTREAVGKKAMDAYKGVKVAYIKGALPAKEETLPQGSAKLEYWPLAAIVSAPDAKTFADYNAMVAKDPAYVESGKNVEAVVRAVNLQM